MTPDERKAAIALMDAIADAIRELSPVPSGVLYAHLMGHMSLDTYERVLYALESEHYISIRNHVITWTGKTPELN